jgi:hypothetical protein
VEKLRDGVVSDFTTVANQSKRELNVRLDSYGTNSFTGKPSSVMGT